MTATSLFAQRRSELYPRSMIISMYICRYKRFVLSSSGLRVYLPMLHNNYCYNISTRSHGVFFFLTADCFRSIDFGPNRYTAAAALLQIPRLARSRLYAHEYIYLYIYNHNNNNDARI